MSFVFVRVGSHKIGCYWPISWLFDIKEMIKKNLHISGIHVTKFHEVASPHGEPSNATRAHMLFRLPFNCRGRSCGGAGWWCWWPSGGWACLCALAVLLLWALWALLCRLGNDLWEDREHGILGQWMLRPVCQSKGEFCGSVYASSVTYIADKIWSHRQFLSSQSLPHTI